MRHKKAVKYFIIVPKGNIAGNMSAPGNNQDVVVTFFVDGESSSGLSVQAVFPVAAGVRAEEDYHLCFRDDLADRHCDHFHFLAFFGW